MNRLSFFLLLFSLSIGLKGQEKTIESADEAYDRFDLEKSHSILESIAFSDSSSKDQKSKALRRLAHQDWKYYQNYALAKERLLLADDIGREQYQTWMLLSRIERESERLQMAVDAALKAMGFAQSGNEVNKAITEYAHGVYTSSISQLEKGEALDTELLAETIQLLSKVLKTDAGLPRPSKLLVGIALLNNSGSGVLKGWQSYFQIQDMQQVNPYLRSSAEMLIKVCENWSGQELSASNQALLIEALSSSRFYQFIPAYIKKNRGEHSYSPKVADAISYSQFLKAVQERTNEYYRLIAIEQEEEAVYREWLQNQRRELWHQLSFSAEKPYVEDHFLRELEERFGARGFTGGTGNYSGYVLALGHIVNQEKAQVIQYGYQPEFTYTQIDMMISNGFSSWFWENKAIGGWATDNEVIRVREVYLNEPINAWKMVTDAVERDKVQDRINEFLDSPTENQTKVAGGLASKLKFDAINDLYVQLASTGLSEGELKLAFLSQYEQYRMKASILAHEGRHSIDQKYMPEAFQGWSNEVREFRAKLSQIVFAPEPRLELAGMVTSTSGEYGHTRANKRIVEVASQWITAHRTAIKGYSDNRSALSQLYLLTNEQIRACYRQADPLHKQKDR